MKVKLTNLKKDMCLYFKSKGDFNKFAFNLILNEEKNTKHKTIQKNNLLELLNENGFNNLMLLSKLKLIDVSIVDLFQNDEKLKEKIFFKFNNEDRWIALEEKNNSNYYFNKLSQILSEKDFQTIVSH